MTFAAKYNANGTVNAGPFSDGTSWDAIPEDSRFWPELMAMTNNGADISPYVAPPAPIPMVSRRRFFQQAAIAKIITEDEALAAVTMGTLPAAVTEFIGSLPDDQQFGAKMLFAVNEFDRSSAMADAFGASLGMTANQIDDFFTAASKL